MRVMGNLCLSCKLDKKNKNTVDISSSVNNQNKSKAGESKKVKCDTVNNENNDTSNHQRESSQKCTKKAKLQADKSENYDNKLNDSQKKSQLVTANCVKTSDGQWIQLSGHLGGFTRSSRRTVMKLCNDKSSELAFYLSIQDDPMSQVCPRFHKEVSKNGQVFIELEDLLDSFTDPNVMDIKMGTRTFLESEVNNYEERIDLYEKMIKISPSEPTSEENEKKAITKLRYMEFREKMSSTANLGFRIEAIRLQGEPPNSNLKTTKLKEEVKDLLIIYFMKENKNICQRFVNRLKEIKSCLESSSYFKNHEFIGSSLLFVYDKDKANIWLIDFAKTQHVSNMNHRTSWHNGNHEDGYLIGLDSLILIMEEYLNDSP